MTYVSPFGDIGTEHEWADALCLSRTHCADAPEETIHEFYQGAITLIDAGVPQPAFSLTRHLAELALKAFLSPDQERGHGLDKLLKRVEGRGDDLFTGGADDVQRYERRLIVDFIRDLDSRDPKGDQGRYPLTTGGVPALAAVCCAEPELLRQHVARLFVYTRSRLSHVRQDVLLN